MKFLGCLLGFVLALFFFVFAVSQQIVAFFLHLLGVRPIKRQGRRSQEQAKPSNDEKPRSDALFEQTGRQYVDFEDIKDE